MMSGSKPEIIKVLEKRYNLKLKRVDIKDLWRNRSFSIDDRGEVIRLNLEGCAIADVSPLIFLTALKDLWLNDNRISDLSPLVFLTALTSLALSDNKVTDVSPLGSLTALDFLNLSNNQITDVSYLGSLTALNGLVLDDNQITDVSPLGSLTALNYLSLNDNQITDVSPLAPLFWEKKLERLDLNNNRITRLPAAIIASGMPIKWAFDFNLGIFLGGNPLESPPVEIVKRGHEAVVAYFQALAAEKPRPLREVKVLLVGDGGAGKTSLARRLLGLGFDRHESQTHGIDIGNWTVKNKGGDITAHLWDFGGQEIMQATHQFFLSKRSLYILVLDGRRDEKTEYWLKLIESFGGDSPLLVVLNKIDQNPGFDVNRRFLQEKYRNIVGFFPISCAEAKGIEAFTSALAIALAGLELLQTAWPGSWFRVKKHLEAMPEHYIDYGRYEEICRAENILDRPKQETLLDLLHDLGVMLHFKEFDLKDTQVLDPEWATVAVYKIINSPELAENKGVLHLDVLETILNRPGDKGRKDYPYPPDKHRYIIGLMEKFELCYPLDRGTRVLVPDLLAVPEPRIDFDYQGALHFIVQYDFLPRSVMPRFIVNLYRDIDGDLQWRTGVVLHDRDFEARAVVKADHEARRIYLYVTGGQRRDYFAVLLATLRRINNSFERLKIDERVPMPDNPEITASYRQLVNHEKEGYEYYLTEDSNKKYRVKDLLGTITGGRAATEEEILKLLTKLVDDKDTKESLAQKAFILQPNIMGVGININNIIDKALSWKKSRKTRD